MSYWKNRMMEQQEDYEWARGLLCEAKALRECDHHSGNYFEGSSDIEDAYKMVNSRITSALITLKPGQTRRNVTDLLKAVYDDNSGLSSCPQCDKNMRD